MLLWGIKVFKKKVARQPREYDIKKKGLKPGLFIFPAQIREKRNYEENRPTRAY